MPKCPICETKVDNYIETYISEFNKQEYRLYHCPHCDLQWWEPLKMIPELYEDDIFLREKYHQGLSKIEYYQKFAIKILKKINTNKSLKLLDIGCGDGAFLQYAKKFGFEIWGIDIDKKSVEIARKKCEANTIYSMSLEEFYKFANSNNIKFDVITFFEVLEHQDKPKEFLKIINRLLKEKGFILGSVPNRERLFVFENRKLAKFDYPPHHLLYFNNNSLFNALNMVNFEQIKIVQAYNSFSQFVKYLSSILSYKFFGSKYFSLKKRINVELDLINYRNKKFRKYARGRKILNNLRFFITIPLAIILWEIYKRKAPALSFYAEKGKLK